MDNNQFSQTTNAQDPLASRRRSTRIDYITTVLLSGKDAGGTPFREFTQTTMVNLHGCTVRTSYRIMVGMLVTIECPKAGTSGKGVCVRVWDPPPGVAGHEVAIQLIKPQNLWAVPNPPPDWELVAKNMVQGRVVQTERTGQFPALAGPSAPAPKMVQGRVVQTERTGQFQALAAPSAPAPVAAPRAPASVAAPRAPAPVAAPRAPASVAVPRAPAIPQAVAPVAPPVVAPVRPAPVAGPTIEQRLAELERRSTRLVESVLDIMRGQAEELTRNSLEEFRQQVDALIQDAEGRLREGLQQAYDESAASLIGLRTDLMEQMASRGAQMVRSSEDTLRTRLRSQLAVEDKTAPVRPPDQPPNK